MEESIAFHCMLASQVPGQPTAKDMLGPVHMCTTIAGCIVQGAGAFELDPTVLGLIVTSLEP